MKSDTGYCASIGEIEEAIDCGEGICRNCGEHHDRVEPDAQRYGCECCGKKLVFGAEEFVLMGWIE